MNVLIDKGIVKKGRPYLTMVRERILKILEELPIATPQRIKEKYESIYQRRICWITVNGRLTELIKEKKLFMVETTLNTDLRGNSRKRVNRIYSLKPFK